MIVRPTKYVLNIQKGGLREIVYHYPKKKVSPAKGQALRAGVLSRLAHKILNRKKKP